MKPTQEYLNKLKNHPTLDYKLVEYRGARKHSTFQCNKCGNYYEKSAKNLLRIKTCKGCDGGAYHKRTEEEVREFLSENGCTLLGNYVNERTPVKLKFSCGHESEAKTGVLRSKFRDRKITTCPACTRKDHWTKAALSLQDANERLKSHPWGQFKINSDYKGWSNYCSIICLDCGNITYEVRPDMFNKRASGCDCNVSSRESSGERTIKIILNDLNVRYVKEKYFKEIYQKTGKIYKYDFYLPDFNLIIEYDGEQHDRTDAFITDAEKDKLAVDMGFEITRIHHTESIVVQIIELDMLYGFRSCRGRTCAERDDDGVEFDIDF